MADKTLVSKSAGAKAATIRTQSGKVKPSAPVSADNALRRQLTELRHENEKLHRQIARHEVATFSLKNRVAALEEILQDYGHIENPRLKRIIEEVQERTRGTGDLLSNGPF